MNNTSKGKIYYSMQAISILPILIYALIILFFSTFFFTNAMYKEVAIELETSAELCKALLDNSYPGDYKLVETSIDGHTAYSLYKGDADITIMHSILDRIKTDTDMDVTLFYEDTRILTTLSNQDGLRLIGTAAPESVINDVLKTGTAKFYDKVIINYSAYFAYYMPLVNSNGKVVGMLFVGKPSEDVNAMINASVRPIIIIGIIALLIAGFFSLNYAKKFVSTLHKLKKYFSKVTSGDSNAEPDTSILKEKDELSEIALAAMSMQRSLRNLAEKDTLTDLYNRRSADKMLRAAFTKSQSSQKPFSLVVADIDHFKSVNDTYGHESGDIVLKNVAKILKAHFRDKGFVARWGGEEFLMVYENCDLELAKKHLTDLQHVLSETGHTINDTSIHVTLTFGVACSPDLNIQELLRKADSNLYIGKANGRNCIIS